MDIEKMLCLEFDKLTLEEKLKYYPNNDPIEVQVFDSLMGFLRPEYALDWVKPIFVPGHPCYDSHEEMREAYDHLLDRLGLQDEDEDVEIMLSCLSDHTRILALEMFQCGREYQRRQEKTAP